MNKLTAGIFAGILTVVAVNAAHADIATTNYVKGAIQSLDSSVAEADGVISTITVTDGKITETVRKKITDKDVDAISQGKVTGLTDALNAKQTANLVTEANVATNKTSDTAYPSMKAAYAIATEIAVQKLGTTATDISDLQGSVEALEENLGKLNDGLYGEIGGLKDLVGTESVSSQIDTKINALDVASVGGSGNIIKSISQENGIISATAGKVAEADLDSALATKINGKLNTNTTTVSAGANYVQTGNTVGQNLDALDAGIKTAADAAQAAAKSYTDTAISGVNSAASELAGKVETNTTNIATNTAAITKLNGTGEGSVKAAADAAQVAAEATAAAALSTYTTTQAATDSAQDFKITANTNAITKLNGGSTVEGSVDYKIEAAKSALNTSIDGKVDIKKDLANKLLTTDATTGQLKDASNGLTKPSDCGTNGVSCMLVNNGDGFKWEKIVDTYPN